MSGYTQTLLLDCNRLSSEEYNASRLSDTDNSLYTNKVANGIKLNIGDQVSINSAYISERGAGANVIEFKGKRLGQNTQITYTNVSNTSFVGYVTYNNDYVMPTGYGRQNFENITQSLAIQDNEVSIAVQFYKNTNGEMNISLPRRFGSISPAGVAYTTAEKYWTTPDADDTGMNVFFRNASHIYAPDWNECQFDSWQQYITASHQKPRPPTFDATTGLPGATNNGSAIGRKLKQDNSRYTMFVKKEIIWSPEFVDGSDAGDAQNYLESLVFNEDITGAFIVTNLRDPALKEYVPYMKKVDLSVKQGYDTPSRIASQLTDKLSEVQDIDPLLHSHRGVNSLDPGGQDVYSRTVDSTLYQNFPAANFDTFSTRKFETFRNGVLRPPGEAENTGLEPFVYINNFAYVAFKRPELVMKGRELNDNAGFHIIEDIDTSPGIGDQPASDIKTSLEWNEDNLTRLRDFFDVQRKFYPELISGNRETNSSFTASFVEDYYGAASASLNASFEDVARFLHINPYSASTLADTLIYNGSTTCLQHRFNVSSAGCTVGNEMNYMDSSPYTANGSGILQPWSNSSETIYNTYAYDTSSLPIYIYYNASSAHLTSADSDGNSDHNLVYGFARRTTGILAYDTITFTTTGINGIALCHFNDGDREAVTAPTGTNASEGWPFVQGTSIQGSHYAQGGGRRLGYDYHFNAYGNAAIIPSTGYNQTDYYGHQQKVAHDFARRCYLGANNPLLNFNTVDNRFEFKNLHTSEKIGNFFNAGDPDPTKDEIAPPPADQASQDCYKINKIDQYNTWSPCMMPYPGINIVKKANVSHTFPEPNVNLERETVMDAHCGITITDMGVTEELWDESIWGILGFSYRQFYPNASVVGNINTRMNNVIVNVSGATTNALISSVDGLEYQVNPFAVNLFTTQLPLATDYGETANWMLTGGSGSADAKDINTIVVNAVSTAITADDLPRKQLRGYFLLSSNIMNDANYFREANPLQVMAVVDKYNAEGDFINYSGGGTVFTVTKPTTLTEVRTAILDPDGSPAQVGQYSGVIYRIDKQINTDLNFAQTLMEQQQQKK
jgi:hypothetical protein